ncbi:hypothetical protein Tco_0820704 [Tanacetum coccineum]|uniref:Uncharacterized protein n=1 Tax=Tanacetum coccineum TaxID=301880 RepID=A0ABQ5AA64_9ASTR
MRKRSAQKDLEVHQTVNAVVEIVIGAESSSFHGPFLQIRFLRILRILGHVDVDASEFMNDVLAQAFKGKGFLVSARKIFSSKFKENVSWLR